MKNSRLALFFSLAIAIPSLTSAQILETTSTGVGIGTSAPSRPLEISGNLSGFGLKLSSSSGAGIEINRAGTSNAGGIYFQTAGTFNWFAGLRNDSDSSFNIKEGNYDGTPRFFIQSSSGNVGIGNTAPLNPGTPNAKVVQLTANDYAQFISTVTNGSANNKVWRTIARSSTSGSGPVFQIQTLDDSGGSEVTALQFTRSGNSVTHVLFPNGNVGIGTSSPSEMLTVNGSVRASSFIGDFNTYSDFVFQPDYKLPALRDVETAIRRDGHLPDIPGEADAKRSGINVVNLQVKLLQKVEELTLYAIAHEKELQQLRRENAELRQQLQSSSSARR